MSKESLSYVIEPIRHLITSQRMYFQSKSFKVPLQDQVNLIVKSPPYLGLFKLQESAYIKRIHPHLKKIMNQAHWSTK